MAKRKPPDASSRKSAELLVTREEARTRLEDRIESGRALRNKTIQNQEQLDAAKNEFNKWDDFNEELLKRIFTTEEFSQEYSAYVGALFMSMHTPSVGEKIADAFKDIDGKIHRLDSILARLELVPLATDGVDVQGRPAVTAPIAKSKKVFIVHGHDDLAKTSLEVLLRELGMDPIVLHRQADEGLTVIEKFEKHGDVGYAFVLLTPDEVAYLKEDEDKADDGRRKEKRARPNVIFEFGYFVGKLGRSRVCCLHTGDVSLPSDVNGLIYKKYAQSVEEVAFGIMKDLNAAGFNVALA